MTSLFVPFELAKIAKEKGFNTNCFAYYDTDGVIGYIPQEGNTVINDLAILAPTHQQLSDWFRNKHNIEIAQWPSKKNFEFYYIKNNEKPVRVSGTFGGYYGSYNKAFQEVFKLI